GVSIAAADRMLPSRHVRFLPSPGAIGLSFVIPAWNSISLFTGALAAALIMRLFPDWAEKKLVVLAAGLIVGESIMGVLGVIISAAG
ncbi:MAG: OPT family oligopeptide transporter, partial [Rhodomicrobium sp.]|nr:OPT family oligopeptide transporter [Rhodomicrobium sp.]